MFLLQTTGWHWLDGHPPRGSLHEQLAFVLKAEAGHQAAPNHSNSAR